MEVLAEYATDEEVLEAEVRFIQVFKAAGADLCNETEGGDGTFGWVPSAETRAKMSKNNANNRPDVRAIISSAMTGENNPMKRPEVRAKVSAAKTGKRQPNVSAAQTGKKRKPFSAEARANLSAAAKAAWERRKA